MTAAAIAKPRPDARAWADRPIRACSCDACAELDLQFPGGGRQLAFPLLPPPLPALRRDHLESRA